MKHEEFIGRCAEIRYNKISFNGKIVNETKNMLFIETEEGIKKIIKQNAHIRFGDKSIEGKDITRRPEDRIKK